MREPGVRTARTVEELTQIHEGLEHARDSRAGLRPAARAALGLDHHQRPPARHESWYPMLALSFLAASARLDATAYLVAAPEIGRSLGVGTGFLGGLVVLHIIVACLSSFAFASRLGRGRRSHAALLGGAGRAIALVGGAFAAGAGGLVAAVVLHAGASGTLAAAHPSLISEIYPPRERIRRTGVHRLAMFLGAASGPPFVLLLTVGLGLTWRAVALAVGVLAAICAGFAVRLRDPGYGRWEAQEIAAAMATFSEAEPHSTPLRLSEAIRRVMAVRTVSRVSAAACLYGASAFPALAPANYLLQARWNAGPAEISLALAAGLAGAAAGVGLWTRLAGPQPGGLRGTSLAAVVGGGLLSVASGVPSAAGFAFAGALAVALLAPILPAMDAVMLAAVRPGLRPHAASLAAFFAGVIGAPIGLLLLGTLPRSVGPAWSLATAGGLASLAGCILASVNRSLPHDLERRADDAIEAQQFREMARSETRLPMLTCHGIDAAYDAIPVLFEADFLVDEAELVCVLGTNGAGKSTLLRVIAGLLPPSSGTVRFAGEDVTGLEADRLVRRGIVTIPPGRSVFGSLSVRENLQAFGHTFLEDRPGLDRAIDRCLETFPVLASRAGQRASTLSGGERQMLALAKAFVLKPRLLLIDELTLGLAPGADVHLYAAVRTLADAGTAVVMVEQSVNVSLSLANRAYFMEQGRVRFQGSPADLLKRKDLLRPVFLGGAARGMAEA